MVPDGTEVSGADWAIEEKAPRGETANQLSAAEIAPRTSKSCLKPHECQYD